VLGGIVTARHRLFERGVYCCGEKKMNIRRFTREKISVAAIALVAGFLGSMMHDWMRGVTVTAATSSLPDVLRAKRYEVVSESGRILSYWGPDDSKLPASTPRGTLLVFMNARGERGVEFGSRTGDKGPTLNFYDRNHRERVRLALSQGDDPLLGLSSTDVDGVVLLGTIEGDVWTDKPGDSWGLRLRSRKARSTIFAGQWRDGIHRAGVRIGDDRGTWALPSDPDKR
jgi:hypothetical protein